jgi:hypothetical protein
MNGIFAVVEQGGGGARSLIRERGCVSIAECRQHARGGIAPLRGGKKRQPGTLSAH